MPRISQVLWVPYDGPVIMRSQVDPHARSGWKDVNLPWLRKHAREVCYQARWWVGASGHRGKWQTHTFEGAPNLRVLKEYAAKVALVSTLWEVEVTMHAQTHGNAGWGHGVVWTFGHAKRMTEAARRLRGETV